MVLALLQREAAVYHDRLSRNVAGRVRAEKGNDVGDIVGLRDPPEHRAFLGSLDHLRGKHPHSLSANEPGGHRIDVHIGRAQLHRGRAGESQQRRFAGGVVGHPEAGAFGLMGAHAHDFPKVLGPKDRGYRPYTIEGSSDIGLQHFGPRFLREAPEGAVVRDAGIVDQKVYPAQPLLGFLHELLDRSPIPDVAALGVDLNARSPESGLGQQSLLADIASRHADEAERHMASQPAELHADVPTKSSGSSGHDDHLAAPPPYDGLRTRLLDGGTGSLRCLVLPRGPVTEAERWQWHGGRSYGRE